jgi:hypothetical protein
MAEPNTIAEEQNSPRQLERLAAQRQLYSKAKKLLVLQVVMVGVLPAIATVIAAAIPDTKGYAALAGLVLALFDALLIDRYQLVCKRQAAKIQELFDCTLFQLPWRELKLGAKPSVETIVSAAATYKKREPDLASLRDWYPPSVSQVPLAFARVICQRINCWWDSTQRRAYANNILSIVMIAVVVLLVVGLLGGLTLVNFIFAVAVVSPLLIWGIREWKRQNDSCNNSDQLRQQIERSWKQVLLPDTTEEQKTAISREIQDEIYDQRRTNPFVFDWFYKQLRPDYEVQMNRGVEAFIEEVKQQGAAH